jgi:glutaredoxin
MKGTMILYTKSNCHACREAKAALDNAGLEYLEVSTDYEEGHAALISASGRLEITPKAMPVLIAGDDLWTGYDVVVAVEEGEVQ